MQSLQARIDSFQKTKRVKRYPSKPSSSATSVKWPHLPDFKANANTLAEAGFFFTPSWDDRDSVTCFLCGKELSDWEENDDPFEIHYTKCRGSCAWAVVRCGLAEDLDNKGRFVFKNKMRLPSCKAMEKARLETFGEDWWPHDGELGHGATSVKMAQAGFVYTPQDAGDDTVTCLYCNLSLGGWETEDDPAQEHRRRDSNSGAACPFLAAVSSRPRRKTKAARGKSAKASVPVSRRSPSPSRTVSRERDPAAVLEVSMDVNVSPAGSPEPHTAIRSPPLSNESHQDTSAIYTSGSRHSLHAPEFPPAPSAPNKSNTSPDTALNGSDLIVSLTSAGQPTIARSQFLTDHERTMSLEQWIRQEISFSHERLLADGRRQIDLFKAKAAELRKCIDEL